MFKQIPVTAALYMVDSVSHTVVHLISSLCLQGLEFIPYQYLKSFDTHNISSAVTLEPPKMKSFIVAIVSPSICHEMMGLDAMISVF